MEIQRGIKHRLYPTPEQVQVLDGQAHAARALWNLLHEWWTMASENRRVSLKDADAVIKQARKDIDFLSALPAQAAQQVLKQYHRSWVNRWEGRAETPRFKSRIRAKMGVDVPQGRDLNITALSRRWSTLKIPKVGTVRFRAHRTIPGTVTGARLVREANGWHIVLRTHWDQPDPVPHPGPTVGIDRGIAVALALSDGTHHTHARWERLKETERLRRLERKAARQRRARKPGERTSNRLTATYDKIASLRARFARRRSHWQHQTTRAIADAYSLIGLEDLNVAGMTRSARGTVDKPGRNVAQKAGLNRSIQGEAWHQLHAQLVYKTTERGGRVVVVPAPHTSQRCHRCGFSDVRNRKSQASFVCQNPICGWVGNADTNAAHNIDHAARQAALREPAQGRGVAGRGGRQRPAKRQPKRKGDPHGKP
ncbi:transposase [Nocardiopsis terrae]|uniref:RNA-guided endonuclease InsQ/TnpB family protein n=1 Tax=Nocardiopsis terrae TaxID=372655 RepID=UPI00174D428F|nr:RNA-guided endonuclease TnpB family protein [Nocardiopsis terrae]GHC90624.1 transposase [Nocardiopsis terrae]